MSHYSPAGWYPQHDGTDRFWDGVAWTPHTRPQPAASTDGSAQPTAPMAQMPASMPAPMPGPMSAPMPAQMPAPMPTHMPAPGHYGREPLPSPYAAWTPTPMGYAVAPKNPAVSLMASFFIPGLGTMLNGQVGKGIGILGGYVLCFFLFFLILPLLVAGGLWIWGMIDAYQGAQQWNRRHGIVS